TRCQTAALAQHQGSESESRRTLPAVFRTQLLLHPAGRSAGGFLLGTALRFLSPAGARGGAVESPSPEQSPPLARVASRAEHRWRAWEADLESGVSRTATLAAQRVAGTVQRSRSLHRKACRSQSSAADRNDASSEYMRLPRCLHQQQEGGSVRDHRPRRKDHVV